MALINSFSPANIIDSFELKYVKRVFTEIFALSAISATLTLSNPFSSNKLQATFSILLRVWSFFFLLILKFFHYYS